MILTKQVNINSWQIEDYLFPYIGPLSKRYILFRSSNLFLHLLPWQCFLFDWKVFLNQGIPFFHSLFLCVTKLTNSKRQLIKPVMLKFLMHSLNILEQIKMHYGVVNLIDYRPLLKLSTFGVKIPPANKLYRGPLYSTVVV